MDLFAVGVTLLVIMFMIVVIRSLFSQSSNTSEFHQFPYDSTPPDGSLTSSGHHHVQSHGGGDVGVRMSHDHHDFGDSGNSGGGGDAGGGVGGGGGE